ncbi:hypothetical protein M413DRAFT_443919 [Hebeloma cylindrosporum]|uniref:Uncharacterized protein n=1 Tax=Hebeloma cylindrosporum TaxID=76867 RepID=A0A0C3C2I1_HEBCY|nr:hypothetical protein M413DRAFT_443919 [Hebeloma cylindrosporum h7]
MHMLNIMCYQYLGIILQHVDSKYLDSGIINELYWSLRDTNPKPTIPAGVCTDKPPLDLVNAGKIATDKIFGSPLKHTAAN